jgi:hypothetical protein
VRALGIDLAAADKQTGAAVVRWSAFGGQIEHLVQPASDDVIAQLAVDCDAIAIDAPLRWPRAFTDALINHRAGGPWPDLPPIELRYRVTDRSLAAEGIWPLSVSTDRIGIVAFRAARLLPRLGMGPNPRRDGSDGTFEVYPAAALARWDQQRRGYKLGLPEHAAGRRAILSWLSERHQVDAAPHADRLVGSSDLLDALICAILAREALEGRTEPIPPDCAANALEEGWIHLPQKEDAP